MHQVITTHETETSQQFKQWWRSGSPLPKTMAVLSTGMAPKSILLIGYLQNAFSLLPIIRNLMKWAMMN